MPGPTREERTESDADRYLLVLEVAERRRSPPVAPGHVADVLDRSPSAATEMLQRLDERDLVRYEAYEGAALTPMGKERAEDLYDTYRILWRFFRDVLDLDAPREEAMALAGAVSPTVAERLAATLGVDAESPTADDGTVPIPSPADDAA